MPRLRLTNKALKPAAYLAIASFIVLATGCSTSKDELLPHGDKPHRLSQRCDELGSVHHPKQDRHAR